MEMLERQTESQTALGDESAANSNVQDGGPDPVQQEAERFVRAADEAVDRVLSADSVAFLNASLQSGGQ